MVQKRKREKAAVIAELYRLMNIHDDECQSLRASIKTIEALMEERKVLLSQNIQGNSDQPVDSKNLPVQASFFTPSSKTCPQTLVDSLKASIPRFMSPTASSRHKQRYFEQQIVGSKSHWGYTLLKTGPLLKRARNSKNGNLKSPKTILKPANNPHTAISLQDTEIRKKKSSWTPSMMIEEMIKEPAAAPEASKLADSLSGGQDSHFEVEISIDKDVVDTDRLSTNDWNKSQRPKRMEKMEKSSRYLSSYPSGRMCRVQRKVAVGCRRKVTVKCSMTVTKSFLY
jgi:hypothetical protein